jgi:hypothetical protein
MGLSEEPEGLEDPDGVCRIPKLGSSSMIEVLSKSWQPAREG